MNSPEQLRISLSAFTVISFLEQLKSWMPSMSLVHLASVSSPAFLSLSGNLNIRATWTECSLALWLQLACSLAHWQLLCLAPMLPFPGMIPWMQSAPASPSVAWEQVFLLLSSGGKELFSETLEALAVYTLIEGTCIGLEWLHPCSPSWLLRVPSFLGVCSLLEASTFMKHTGPIEGTLI